MRELTKLLMNKLFSLLLYFYRIGTYPYWAKNMEIFGSYKNKEMILMPKCYIRKWQKTVENGDSIRQNGGNSLYHDFSLKA